MLSEGEAAGIVELELELLGDEGSEGSDSTLVGGAGVSLGVGDEAAEDEDEDEEEDESSLLSSLLSLSFELPSLAPD